MVGLGMEHIHPTLRLVWTKLCPRLGPAMPPRCAAQTKALYCKGRRQVSPSLGRLLPHHGEPKVMPRCFGDSGDKWVSQVLLSHLPPQLLCLQSEVVCLVRVMRRRRRRRRGLHVGIWQAQVSVAPLGCHGIFPVSQWDWVGNAVSIWCISPLLTSSHYQVKILSSLYAL